MPTPTTSFSKRLRDAVYRAKRALWPSFDATQAETERLEKANEARLELFRQLRNRPEFTCPVCGCHYWGTGYINDDGTARAYCQPSVFMRPCKFSWIRPYQDGEVGLEGCYDQSMMIETVRRRRIKEGEAAIIPPD